ncbi:MAG: hypothetical protein LBS71_03005 [Puniceicoccales bacterium]|nr:hypothetical protein [Puniceicoccales bacterium]
MRIVCYFLGVLYFGSVCFGSVEPKGQTVNALPPNIPVVETPKSPTASDKKTESAVTSKVFDKTPLACIKITNFEEVLNNQKLLDALNINNTLLNILLLAQFPSVGNNCNAFKKGTNVGVFFFRNLQENFFPCAVFQLAENNSNFKEYLKKNKIPFFDCDGYTILTKDETTKESNLDLITKEKDFPKTLVDLTKQPLVSSVIEINVQQPFQHLVRMFSNQLSSKDATANYIKEINLGLQLDSNGLKLNFDSIFDSTFSHYAQLKSENYKEFKALNIGEYIEAKDVNKVTVAQNIGWAIEFLMESLRSFVQQDTSQINKSKPDLIEKMLIALKGIIPEVRISTIGTFQNQKVTICNDATKYTEIEKYFDAYKSLMAAVNDSYNELYFKAINDKNIAPFTFESKFLCDYNGAKIYSYTISVNEINPTPVASSVGGDASKVASSTTTDKGGNTIPTTTSLVENTPKATVVETVTGTQVKQTDYVILYNGQILQSNSLDYLKMVFDNVVAKKLPTVTAESYLGGFPKGTAYKTKFDLSKMISYILPQVLQMPQIVQRAEVENSINGFLSQLGDGGVINIGWTAQNDRLQYSISLDYASFPTIISASSFTFSILFDILVDAAAKASGPQKKPAEEQKSPTLTPVKTSYIFNSNPILCEADRQILIPVKILTEYKAIG